MTTAMTPKKLVHWHMNSPSFSNINSPFFDGTSESSMVSTSSMEYINAQLVAHGFTPSPGLCLDGISNDDSARVVKCLLGMLGQRVVRVPLTVLKEMSFDNLHRKICLEQKI